MARVTYRGGRLQVQRAPSAGDGWKPVENPRCSCGDLAAWHQPKLGLFRCRARHDMDPAAGWAAVELPRCSACGDLAAWQHPTLGHRCITCPRPR